MELAGWYEGERGRDTRSCSSSSSKVSGVEKGLRIRPELGAVGVIWAGDRSRWAALVRGSSTLRRASLYPYGDASNSTSNLGQHANNRWTNEPGYEPSLKEIADLSSTGDDRLETSQSAVRILTWVMYQPNPTI